MINLKNKKRIYTICSIAAIISLGLTACTNSQNKTATNNNETSVQQKDSKENNSSQNDTTKEKNEAKSTNSQNVYVPKFSKNQLEKDSKVKFNTPWKSSLNGTFSACIDGKGPEAIEEGVGRILVKDSNNNISSFEILDNKKISPTFIDWADNKNLFVAIGSAQGTVSKGGNLYLLDVSTGKASLVLQTPDKKQQIMTAKKVGDNINLKVNVYDDDNFDKSHIENWTIYAFDINLSKPMDVKDSEGKIVYVINGDNQ